VHWRFQVKGHSLTEYEQVGFRLNFGFELLVDFIDEKIGEGLD